MKLSIKDPALAKALDLLEEDLGIGHQDCQPSLIFDQVQGKTVSLTQTDDGDYLVQAPDLPHALNALHRWVKGQALPITYQFHFSRNGLMLDNSRNAVASVSMVKYLLRKMALMGHTWYMLYMEDTYEIPDQPYFGAFRGRYSQSQLKELDDYAHALGIELVPCIQTLAHLNQFFEWEHIAGTYADIDDILNVSKAETKTLIRQMLTSLRQCFRTKTIHLGMDEAYNLGRGSYLNDNGLRSKTAIMQDHLTYMLDLCQELGWDPMIWDDMFFSWYNQLAPTEDFKVPEGISLMYWDYYNESKDHYVDRIQTRGKITDELHFAGGAWRWTGYVPHHKKTFHTSIAALAACKETGVDQVIATAWGDDSSEAPFYTVLFGLVLYAHLDQGDFDESKFDQDLQAYTGLNLEEWYWQGEFDLLPAFDELKALDVTTSKYLLYQDLMMPLLMAQIESLEVDYGKAMLDLADRFSSLDRGEPVINQFYAAYGQTLSIKWRLPLSIYQAYQAGDKAALQAIVDKDLPALEKSLEDLCQARRQVWLWEANPIGLEVLEHRFGAMIMRAKTTASRLQSYIDGQVDALEELEEVRLDGAPQASRAEKQAINYNRALRIMSRSRASW